MISASSFTNPESLSQFSDGPVYSGGFHMSSPNLLRATHVKINHQKFDLNQLFMIENQLKSDDSNQIS